METISTTDEGRNDNPSRREVDQLDKFTLDQLKDNAGIIDIRNKSIEIINKNNDLVRFQKKAYLKKYTTETLIKDARREFELNEINKNKLKTKPEQLTKDQLEVLIMSKIPSNLLNDLSKIENEISICEIISKNHNLVSDQLKNYNLSEVTRRKGLENNNL